MGAKPYLCSRGECHGTAETRRTQRKEQGRGRSKQSSFSDLSSSGRDWSVSASFASLRCIGPSFYCMVAAKSRSTTMAAMAPDIDSLIVELRGQRVILDADLATIYGVSTKRLNEQVKRNEDRFPPDFAFQLTAAEKAEVVANCDHLARLKFSPVLPRAFTEHGAIMAATVLNSPRAVQMSVFVVRAFVKMRAALIDTRELARKLAAVEADLKSRLD